MSHYKIIADEAKLDEFIASLPDHRIDEVYYVALFGRNKYSEEFPKAKDSSQLARIFTRKDGLKERIRRLEGPIGCYTRDGIPAPQNALALYIGVNPRSLVKANKCLLVELAKRIADGHLDFNPVTAATTEVHRAVGTKNYVDFDFDFKDDGRIDHRAVITDVLPSGSYRVLMTRGGFHLIVDLAHMKGSKSNWYQSLSALPGCDVRGSECLTPVPGCVQGNFVPYFVDVQTGA